jgi:hypothetical protein
MAAPERSMDIRNSANDDYPQDDPPPCARAARGQQLQTWQERLCVWFYPTVTYVTVMAAFLSLAPTLPMARLRIVLFGAVFFWTVMWGSYAFSGDPYRRRTHALGFAYYFVFLSFAIFSLPTLVLGNAIGGEPLGIISGCVREQTAAEQVRCERSADGVLPPDAPAPAVHPSNLQLVRTAVRNQWLVNVGGTIRPQVACDPKVDAEIRKVHPEQACTLGSPGNRVYVSGGIVVPLPFVMVALVGGAISLSRRVPEIQRCSETYDHDPPRSARRGGPGTPLVVRPELSAADVRLNLLFLIVQFTSAPMLASVAYQVIEPESASTSTALAFMCGFGSEAVLKWIKSFGEGIGSRKPDQAGQRSVVAATGAIYGIVKAHGQPREQVRVGLFGSAASTYSDDDGLFFLAGIRAGEQQLIVEGCRRRVAVHVAPGEAVRCTIDLDLLEGAGQVRPVVPSVPST